MQGISVYQRNSKQKIPLYHAYHERNGEYLERENDTERFLVLKEVDDCDPSSFYTSKALQDLITDLDLVIDEADRKQDEEISNHLREILVLCKLCLWNLGDLVLVMSPYDFVPKEKYPQELPEKYLINISYAGSSE